MPISQLCGGISMKKSANGPIWRAMVPKLSNSSVLGWLYPESSTKTSKYFVPLSTAKSLNPRLAPLMVAILHVALLNTGPAHYAVNGSIPSSA